MVNNPDDDRKFVNIISKLYNLYYNDYDHGRPQGGQELCEYIYHKRPP